MGDSPDAEAGIGATPAPPICQLKMKTMDLQFVKDCVAELGLSPDGKEPDGTYWTALVVVSAMACGPDSHCLARFTQLPVEFVQANQLHLDP